MKTLSMMTTENGHVSNYRFPSVGLLEKTKRWKRKDIDRGNRRK